MRPYVVIVLCMVSCIVSSSTFATEPNLQYAAKADTTVPFTGAELIYIPEGDSSDSRIQTIIDLLRIAAVDAGLTITDSTAIAERMLTFDIHPYSKAYRRSDHDSTQAKELTDTTFSSIRLYVYDIQRRVEGHTEPIWAGVLNATDQLFYTYLDRLLLKLLRLYGKNDDRREVYDPSESR